MVTFDSRGCGASNVPPGSTPFSLDQFAADAIGLLDVLGIERVHWAGEASGGIVGIVAACRYPQRIASLTLSNTPIRIPQATNDVFVDAEVRQYGTGYWARKSSANRVDEDKVPREWIEWTIGQYDRIPPQVAIALHRMLESADSLPLLPCIQAPTLILASERSRIAVREEMEKMTRQIPRGKLVVFEGYGQGITWMVPERCVAEIKSFIDEIEE